MYLASVPLLVVFCIGGATVLGSYGLPLRKASDAQKESLWAGLTGAAKVFFGVMPMIATACVIYDFWFIQNFLDGRATIFGASFKSAGEIAYCVIYGLLLALSSCWIPLALPTIATNSQTTLSLTITALMGVGLCAWILFAMAMDTSIARSGGDGYLIAHQVTSCIFAIHTFFVDGVMWSYNFYKMIERHRQHGQVYKFEDDRVASPSSPYALHR